MEKIIIETISDALQRYNTVGDYYHNENGDQVVMVSDMNNWKYEFLIALHELIESRLCMDRNITEEMIDIYDFAFEERRKLGAVTGEPGDQPDAPYFKEHQCATKIERMAADELGVNWEQYVETYRTLDQNQNTV